MDEYKDFKDQLPSYVNEENFEVYKMRHTAEHVLHMAVEDLFPEVRRAMGPPTEEGYYLDFDPKDAKFSDSDLAQIEKRMKEIMKQKLKVWREDISYEKARELFGNNEYKMEFIDEYEKDGKDLTVYWIGNPKDEKTWEVDLCKGPHVEHTGKIGYNKLLSVAGAYWRGDENNKMLTRIYGTAFKQKDALKNYLWQIEEAKKRDHRKIGKELQLFAFDKEVGAGLPLWLPRGAKIVEELEKLAKEKENAQGYQVVKSPHIAKEQLYLKSGHLPYYEEDMFPPMVMDNEKYYLKAMNCPHHHKMYDAFPKSYRDLPLRLAEYGDCYRYEDSGALFGLMRVRSLSMNDAHIYCTEDQFQDEFSKVIELYMDYFEIFGIEKYQMRLSKHSKEGLGKKYIDNEELWIKTEDQVRKALVKSGVDFVEAEDEAAFYGPKIDVQIWSVIGREFTLSTNQLDFAVPARFNLTYKDKDGKSKTPICIHRAPLSTHERMVGFLIEHFAGKFPAWLSPDQVAVIPISDEQNDYAKGIEQELFAKGIRAKADTRKESMQSKIRDAQALKIPFMLIVGKKEVEEGNVSLRYRSEKKNVIFSREDVIEKISANISERKLDILL